MIGLIIKNFRDDRKLTQGELAKKIGMTQSQVSKIEKGERKVTVNELKKLAKALGVTIAELLEGEIA